MDCQVQKTFILMAKLGSWAYGKSFLSNCGRKGNILSCTEYHKFGKFHICILRVCMKLNIFFYIIRHIPARGSRAINDGRPVILYMHGNAHSR